MNIQYSENKYELLLSKRLYSESVILKCFYWYTGNFKVEISEASDEQWQVVLENTNKDYKEELFKQLQNKIYQDLIDFKLRELVSVETKTIRELIIAKAFANYESTETPSSAITDPVGFDPTNISNNGKTSY